MIRFGVSGLCRPARAAASPGADARGRRIGGMAARPFRTDLKDLLGFVNDLEVQGVQFVSLTEQMDTTTPTGRLVFQIFGALAEYGRGPIRERALAGSCPRARARGRLGGQPGVMTAEKLQTAQILM